MVLGAACWPQAQRSWCWALGAGRWALGAGRWALGAGLVWARVGSCGLASATITAQAWLPYRVAP